MSLSAFLFVNFLSFNFLSLCSGHLCKHLPSHSILLLEWQPRVLECCFFMAPATGLHQEPRSSYMIRPPIPRRDSQGHPPNGHSWHRGRHPSQGEPQPLSVHGGHRESLRESPKRQMSPGRKIMPVLYGPVTVCKPTQSQPPWGPSDSGPCSKEELQSDSGAES